MTYVVTPVQNIVYLTQNIAEKKAKNRNGSEKLKDICIFVPLKTEV